VHHRISSLQAVAGDCLLFCVRIVCGKRKVGNGRPLAGRLIAVVGKRQAQKRG
jgi:hypothetical protein